MIVGAVALSGLPRSSATEQSSTIPAWLMAHVGEAAGQIAQPVVQRARSLYLQKLSSGTIRNPCYFAMDATRPNDPGAGRFYVICEAQHAFHAIAAGHGSGQNLPGAADFANGRRCVRNFGNALDSDLTAGGVYVTAEAKTSFKGYYRVSAHREAAVSAHLHSVRWRRRDCQRQAARNRRPCVGGLERSLYAQGAGQPLRER